MMSTNSVHPKLYGINSESHTRGYIYKLHKLRSYSSVRASYFSNCVTHVWNSLPADRVEFSTFVSFKRNVQQIDFASF